MNDRRLVLPAWSLVLLFALPPLIAVGRWRRAMRRTRLNLCPTCGYDLRATPERCPECGTAVAERAAI